MLGRGFQRHADFRDQPPRAIMHRGERIFVAGLETAQVVGQPIDPIDSDLHRTVVAEIDVARMFGEIEMLFAINAVLDHA